MAEEIKDAGKTVPRAMVGSYILNGITGLIFLISFMFMITDVESALDDPTGYPHMWVFLQALSPGGAVALNFIPTLLLFAGTLSLNVSTSRQTWAFARDKGLPFSNWIGRVNKTSQVPVNAVTCTCLTTIALSLINIGSDVALGASKLYHIYSSQIIKYRVNLTTGLVISLNLVSLMSTYILSIGAVLYRRIHHPELLPPCRWSLGRWGIPINIGGLLYSCQAFFWSFWPESVGVTLDNFNWAVVMFVGVGIVCMIDYVLRGRKHYKGPVVLVNG
jgi:amino acid transporter